MELIKALKQDLIRVLGNDGISNSETICRQHSRDEGVDRNNHVVDLVVWPQSTAECSLIASACYEKKVPMIPFGTGTGLESGVCGVYVIRNNLQNIFIILTLTVFLYLKKGGVSVDMSKMDQIVDFNPEDFDVTVQPGVTRKGLNHFLKDHGLWFPVGKICHFKK